MARGYLCLLLSVICSSAAQLVLKRVANQSPISMDSIIISLITPWRDPGLLISITLYVCAMGLMIISLSLLPLISFAMLSSLSYIVILLGSWYFYDERFGISGFSGTLLIIGGVILVLLDASPQRTQKNIDTTYPAQSKPLGNDAP